MPLVNARYDQLPPNGSFTGEDLVSIWNFITGVCESVKIKDLAAFGNITQNFEWVSPHAYLADEVVTRGGNWYQALVNNNGVTPGTDPTIWALITKSSSGLVMWSAGVFPQDIVFVLSDHKGYIDLYQLVDTDRPFVSSDIESEELNEQWESVLSPRVLKAATMTTGDCQLDFTNDREKLFYGTIGEAKDWELANEARAIYFSFIVNFTTLSAQTFPADWLMSDIRKAGLVWTPASIGRYKVEGHYDETYWIVEINSEPYN